MPASDGDVDRSAAGWRIERDVYGRETRVIVHQRTESTPTPTCTAWRTEDVRVGVRPTIPGSAWVESTSESEVAWPEVTARTRARLELRSDPTTYRFDLTLDVFENDEPLGSRRWEQTTPRKLQ